MRKKLRPLKQSKNRYRIFSVAADVVVFNVQKKDLKVLLIQRRYPPYKGRWALPGGFLEPDEDAITAARRELKEETGLRVQRLVEFGSFSNPQRDPRGRVVTISFYSLFNKRNGVPSASDDASHLDWFAVSRLPPLAFDHREMIRRAEKHFKERRKKIFQEKKFF